MKTAAATSMRQSAGAAPAATRAGFIQRQCACGQHTPGGSECDKCSAKKPQLLQRRSSGGQAPDRVPPIVHDVLSSSGQPLDRGARAFMEQRMGHDFSSVRVHADAKAGESARALNAAAYTTGNNVVLGPGQPSFATREGKALLAHELVHVMQQSASPATSPTKVGDSGDIFEREADAISQRIASGGAGATAGLHAPPVVQRTMMCSRPIQSNAVAGAFANHSWIDDTGNDDCMSAGMPGNYAVMHLQSGDGGDGCATKQNNSPDPGGGTPKKKVCQPKAGVTDIHACMRAAYDAYASPGYYSTTKGLIGGTVAGLGIGGAAGAVGGVFGGAAIGRAAHGSAAAGGAIGGILGGVIGLAAGGYAGMRIAGSQIGPNSNTFAGTLARACCADASDSGLGWVPAWNHEPATPCTAQQLAHDPHPDE